MKKCFNRFIAGLLTLILTMSLMASVTFGASLQPQNNNTYAVASKDSIKLDNAVTKDENPGASASVGLKPFKGSDDLVASMKAEQAKNPESEIIDPAEVKELEVVTASIESKGVYTLDQIKAELEIAIFSDRQKTTIDVVKYNLTKKEIQFITNLVLKENSAELLVTLTFTTNSAGIADQMKVEMNQVYENGLDSLDKINGVGEIESSTTEDVKVKAATASKAKKMANDEVSDTVEITATGSYDEPTFLWSQDNASCTATFKSKEDGTTVDKSCVVTVKQKDKTCTEDGYALYTAVCDFDGNTYAAQRNIILPASHTYTEPEFIWTRTADGDFTCVAKFGCEFCTADIRMDCSVTGGQTQDGRFVYTGSCNFNGKEYTNEYDATTKQLYADWGAMCQFYADNAAYYGVATDYWLSKDTDADPMGAIKELVGVEPDKPIPASYMSQILVQLREAFSSYVYYYGEELLKVRDDAISKLDDQMTETQKALVLHDYICNIAVFDMSSLAKYQNSGASPDPISLTPFGALLTGKVEGVYGCVCIGYAAAYTYLLQSAYEDIYKDENGNYKTSEVMQEEDSAIVDFGMIKYNVDTSEVSVAGPDSGFTGRFTQTHYFNALKVDGQWYYADVCYDDIEPETMSQYRVETDGNLHHMNFLFSHESLVKQYDGYYDYISSLHATGDKACDSKTYEDVWFSKVNSPILYDDNYWYYVEGPFSYLSMLDYMNGDSQFGGQFGGGSMSDIFDSDQFKDKLKRRPRSIKDETDDSKAEVLIDYGTGNVMDLGSKTQAANSWLVSELDKDDAYYDIYPEINHSLALRNNILYFNVGNKIAMYDLSNSQITQLKEYNDVYAVSNENDFIGSSFDKANADAKDIKFHVVNHPVASFCIKSDDKMYVSVATNYSNSKNSNYSVESVNYNRNYNRFSDDNEEDANTNVEFMWCANVKEVISMTDIDKYLAGSSTFKDVEVQPWCAEQGYVEPRDTVTECSDGLHKKEDSVKPELGHHYVYNDTEQCRICSRCYGVLEEEEGAPTDTSTGHSYENPQFNWTKEDYTYSCTVTLHCSVCNNDGTFDCDVDRGSTATETASGTVSYVATCTVDGQTYTDSKDEDVSSDHLFGSPVFTWTESNGGYECKATYTCTTCSDSDNAKTEIRDCIVSTADTSKCGEAGTITYTASSRFNGIVYTETKTVDGKALDHAYGNEKYQWGQDETGQVVCYITFTCSRCQEQLTAPCEVAMSAYTPSTCTDPGNVTYTATYTLGATNYTTSMDAAIPPSHSYGNPVFTWGHNVDDSRSCQVKLTCAQGDAEKTVVCKVTTESLTEATCETAGSATYKATCVVNGQTYEDTNTETIKATGHYYNQQDYIWGTDSNGKATCKFIDSCKGCDDKGTGDCDVTETIVDQTCTEPGESVYTATHTFDGRNYSVTRTATNTSTSPHTYGEAKADWKDENGVVSCNAVAECSVCGTPLTVPCVIKENRTEATCTQAGEIVYTATCTIDGKDFIAEKKVAMEAHHEYGSPSYEWGKDSANNMTCQAIFSCSNCDEKATVDCSVDTKKTEATCTANGNITYKATCSFNGQSYDTTKVESIPAKGHDLVYKDNNNGTCTITCKRCDYHATKIVVPGVVKNVKAASYSYNSIKISWSKVAGADKYRVYRKSGSTWKLLGETKGFSYVNKSLSTGTSYQYKVQSVNSAGENKNASTVKATPVMNIPTVKAASAGYDSTKISWNKISGASGYYVYVKSGDSWKTIKKITSGSTLSYKHSKLVSGKSYTYTVRAYRNQSGKVIKGSYNKKGVKATPIPGTPKWSKAKTSKYYITLKWGKVSGASGYYIYRSTSGSKNKLVKKITKGSTTSWSNSKLRSKTKYTYTIVAFRIVKGKVVKSKSVTYTVKTK